MLKTAALLLTLAAALPAAAADEKPDAAARAKAVAPFLDDQTIVVAHVDLARFDTDALVAKLATLLPIDPEGFARSRTDFRRWTATLTRAGAEDAYVVFSLADLPTNPPYLIVPLPANADAAAIKGLATPGQAGRGHKRPDRPFPAETGEKLDGVVFLGSKAALARLRDRKPVRQPELEPAFAAVHGTGAQVLVLPSPDVRRVVDEVLPSLPEAVGGGSGKRLTQGIRWAALGIDTAPHISLRLVIKSEDAEAAEALRQMVVTGLNSLAAQPQVKMWLPDLRRYIPDLTPKVEDSRLTLALDDKTLSALLKPAVGPVRRAAFRTGSTNNLKQIGIAMFNYLDVNKHFPMAANYDKNGKPLLSWRVHILPFVEQNQLYKEFHLDEPWDSEHNKKLIARMPQVYRSSPNLPAKEGKTTYLGVAGKDAMFPGNQPLSIRDVTDGTSNTAWVVDADDAQAVPWTKPADFEYDPAKPMAGLVGHYPGGFLALFVDASVHFLPAKVDAKTLTAIFTRNGGEVVSLP
jgi:hypothetical protein